MFHIRSHVIPAGEQAIADLASPQEQTGKGTHLRVARAPDGRPVRAPAVRGMQTGEGNAKVLRGVGLKDSLRRACRVATDRKASRGNPRGAFLLWGLQ